MVVGLALAGIQHRLRRAYQGRIKDLSDFYIEEKAEHTGTELTGVILEVKEGFDETGAPYQGNPLARVESGMWGKLPAGKGAPARDIIDYAKKPPTVGSLGQEINYPELVYIRWEQDWCLICKE